MRYRCRYAATTVPPSPRHDSLDRTDDPAATCSRCSCRYREGACARVREHSRVSDETGRDDRDADAVAPEILSQPQREASQPELGSAVHRREWHAPAQPARRRTRGGPGVAGPSPGQAPAPARSARGDSRSRIVSSCAVRTSSDGRSPEVRRWRPGRRPPRPRRSSLRPAGNGEVAAIGRPSTLAASPRVGRPATGEHQLAPRAANARAIARPMPPVAPVKRTFPSSGPCRIDVTAGRRYCAACPEPR